MTRIYHGHDAIPTGTRTLPHPSCGGSEEAVNCLAPATTLIVIDGALTPKFRCVDHSPRTIRWAEEMGLTLWIYDLVLRSPLVCDCEHPISEHQTGEGPWTGFCGHSDCECEAAR